MKVKISSIFWFLVAIYILACWEIDKRCREFEGWEFYSLFPTPTCHVYENKASLKFLESLYLGEETKDFHF